MKELHQHIKDEVRGKITREIPKQTEYALMGVIKPKKGHTVFEFNLDTNGCNPATYKTNNVMFSRLKALHPIKELVVKKIIFIYPP